MVGASTHQECFTCVSVATEGAACVLHEAAINLHPSAAGRPRSPIKFCLRVLRRVSRNTLVPLCAKLPLIRASFSCPL
jgi:hypothetical protein